MRTLRIVAALPAEADPSRVDRALRRYMQVSKAWAHGLADAASLLAAYRVYERAMAALVQKDLELEEEHPALLASHLRAEAVRRLRDDIEELEAVEARTDPELPDTCIEVHGELVREETG